MVSCSFFGGVCSLTTDRPQWSMRAHGMFPKDQFAMVREGNLGNVKQVLSPHNVNSVDGQGKCVLHHACTAGHASIAQWLLSIGAVVDSKDFVGVTPLMAACRAGQAECVSVLLDAGAVNSIADSMGNLPLHMAIYSGHSTVAALMIAADPGCIMQSSRGLYPLHVAAMNGIFESVGHLCKAGATVDATTSDGVTPLFLALREGNEQCAIALLSYGAQISRVQLDSKDLPAIPQFALDHVKREACLQAAWAALGLQKRASPVVRTNGRDVLSLISAAIVETVLCDEWLMDTPRGKK